MIRSSVTWQRCRIESILGEDASLLQHQCKTIAKENLHLPGPDFIEKVVSISDRSSAVLSNLGKMFQTGRLARTGYLSILPVDQGIEHSAGASFAPNIAYFDPENIVKLAIEGGCNAVASTLGVLGAVSKKYAAQDPVHRQAESQRVPVVPERVRSDHVRQRQAGGQHGRGGRRRDDLLRVAGVEAADPGSLGDVSGGARERPLHRALVLHAERRVQDEGARLPPGRGPDRPGESSRRDDRGRHHQAEAAGGIRRRLHRS